MSNVGSIAAAPQRRSFLARLLGASNDPNAVGNDVPDYTGPTDGLSHPKAIWLMRPLNKAVIAGRFRVRVQGKENIPTDGPNMYCPTHPSMFDPPLVPAVVDPKDMRFMANKFVFDSIRGKLMSWGGAFPVDREKPGLRPARHTLDLLRNNIDVCVFPEGSLPEEHLQGKIGAIKKGPAAFALKGGAKYIVPMAIHYWPNTEKRPRETACGLMAATAVASAGVLAATSGGPTAQLLAGTVAAGLTAAYVGGKIAHTLKPEPEWSNQWPKYIEMLKWGAVSGLGGALAGAFVLPHLGAAATSLMSLAAGAATWMIARGWRDRDIADVTIEKPIALDAYRTGDSLVGAEKGRNRKAMIRTLTIDLHRAMGRGKEKLTGVPYDDEAEKFRGTIIEHLRGGAS